MARKLSIVLAVVLAIFAASPNLGHAQGRGGGFHGGGFHGGFGFRGGGCGWRGWWLGLGLGSRLGLGLGLASGLVGLGSRLGLGFRLGLGSWLGWVLVGVGALAGFGSQGGVGSGARTTLLPSANDSPRGNRKLGPTSSLAERTKAGNLNKGTHRLTSERLTCVGSAAFSRATLSNSSRLSSGAGPGPPRNGLFWACAAAVRKCRPRAQPIGRVVTEVVYTSPFEPK